MTQVLSKFPVAEQLKISGITPENVSLARKIPWGTYGPDGLGLREDNEDSVTWKHLDSLDTDHLENILVTQQIFPAYRRAILDIIKERITS